MNRVLMLAEKLAAAPSLFTEGVKVASRLGALGVSCSLTRQQPSQVSSGGMIFPSLTHAGKGERRSSRESLEHEQDVPVRGNSSRGVGGNGRQECLPHESASDGQIGSLDCSQHATADQVIEAASANAVACGLRCDTLKTNWSLPRLAETLAPHFALAMISRVDGDSTDVVASWWREILKRVQRPILMLGALRWTRIVVAGATDEELVSLNAWARHWSCLWNVPVTQIQLRPLRWTAWHDWKTRCSEAIINSDAPAACVRYCGLKPTDLVLVARRAACWPSRSDWSGLQVPQLVQVTSGSVGVLPMFYVPSILEMLHGDRSPTTSPTSFTEHAA